MQNLKIWFTDFWGFEQFVFNPKDNYFYDLMSQEFNVVLDPNPDILFFSCFGNDNLNFKNCKKVYFCGENQGNNFKHPESVICDMSFSHFGQHIDDKPSKHIYFPLWVLFVDWYNKTQPRPLPSNPTHHIDPYFLSRKQDVYKKTKFCAFINNNPIQDRLDIFHILSQYKKVDSYGKLHNNMGFNLRGSEEDKINLLKDYKFTIAFENSFHDGYNTEKIIQPLSVGCIPLYKGGEKWKKYFNSNLVFNFNDRNNWENLVKWVIQLDNNEEEFSNLWLNNRACKYTCLEGTNDYYPHYFEFLPMYIRREIKRIL